MTKKENAGPTIVGSSISSSGKSVINIGSVGGSISTGDGESSQPTERAGHLMLFVATCPLGTEALRLDEEIRGIIERLRLSDRPELQTEILLASRPADLRFALMNLKPSIVHFCGHGVEDGSILLEDVSGRPLQIGPMVIAELLELCASSLEVAVFNLCHSRAVAEASARTVAYTIGIDSAIEDRASIEFSLGFYDALFTGQDPEHAFRLGLNAMKLAGLPSRGISSFFRRPESG